MAAPTLRRRYWTTAEENRLRRLAPYHTAAEIARLLKRTEKAIVDRARLLGIQRQKYGDDHTSTRYRDDMVREMLRRYFREGQSVRRIAAALGVARSTVVSYTSGQRRAHLRAEFVR